jgi:phage virion morphogenesis protein
MGSIRGMDELVNELSGFISNAENRLPIMKEVAQKLRGSIQENFRSGGRPEKWAPSKRSNSQHGQPLHGTGRLMKSLTQPGSEGYNTEVTSDGINIGSGLRYAAIHQFGFDGSEQVKAHSRSMRSGNLFGRGERVNKKTGEITMGRVQTGSGVGFVNSFTRHMRMPARPYIVFQDKDLEDVARITMRGLLA